MKSFAVFFVDHVFGELTVFCRGNGLGVTVGVDFIEYYLGIDAFLRVVVLEGVVVNGLLGVVHRLVFFLEEEHVSEKEMPIFLQDI